MKGGGKFQRMLIFHIKLFLNYASVLLPYICMVCGILSVCVLFDPCFSLEHAFLYDVVIIPVTRVSIWERRVGRFDINQAQQAAASAQQNCCYASSLA